MKAKDSLEQPSEATTGIDDQGPSAHVIAIVPDVEAPAREPTPLIFGPGHWPGAHPIGSRDRAKLGRSGGSTGLGSSTRRHLGLGSEPSRRVNDLSPSPAAESCQGTPSGGAAVEPAAEPSESGETSTTSGNVAPASGATWGRSGTPRSA